MDAGCLLELDVRGELVASLNGGHCDDLVVLLRGVVVVVWLWCSFERD